MISLTRLIDIMIHNGGWFDVEAKRLIKDSFKRIDKMKCVYIPIDCYGNSINIRSTPERYVRIPYLNPMKYSQYMLEKYSINNETLDEYGISGYVENQYEVFNHSVVKDSISAGDKYFVDQVGRIMEDHDLDYPDVKEYALRDIYDWCTQNEIGIIDDYNPKQ